MPGCALRYCVNNSRNVNKCKGITFHRFPRQNHANRAKWIKFVQKNRSENSWLPSDHTYICSLHFRDKDKYTTKNGRWFLKKTAVPCDDIANAKSDTESMSYDQDVVEDSVAQQIDGSTKIKRKISYPSGAGSSKERRRNPRKVNTDVVPQSYSDAESVITEDEEAGDEVETSIEGSTRTISYKKPSLTVAKSSEALRTTMKQVATDVMGTMVIDDITNPSKPVKRRIDVLLKMCRSMMREKDHEISILKEQVEELTKKNVRLRNALVDMKGKTRIDAEDPPEETPANTPAPKLVKEVKKVKRKQTKRTESNEVTRGAFPKPMRLKDEPIEMEIEINVEKQHLNNDNDRNNPSEQIAQEIDPLVIKEEREMDCEGDIRDVEAMDVLPICTEQMSCEKANLSRTNIIVQETSGTELWTIIKEEDVDLSE